MREARLSPSLPDHLARLYVPDIGKFDTPLDAHGIVDIDKMFELALWTYPDDLPEISIEPKNRHHVYWTEEWWNQFAESQTNDQDRQTVLEFRGGTPQIAYIPIIIHRWIEYSQIPPPPPSLLAMRRRNLSWEAAKLLFDSAEEVKRARQDYETKKDTTRTVLGSIVGITPVSQQLAEPVVYKTDEAYWHSQYRSRLAGWQVLVSLHSTIPRPYRIIETTTLKSLEGLRKRYSSRHSAVVPAIPNTIAA